MVPGPANNRFRIFLHIAAARWGAAIVVFVLALLASTYVVIQQSDHAVEERREDAQKQAEIYSQAITSEIQQSVSVAYPIATLIRLNQNVIPFEPLANQILKIYPAISALQLAPDGVIRQIVPLAGNERALGLDLMKAPGRREEILAARKTGEMLMTRPFELVQGGYGVAGRLPVFLDMDPQHPGKFWGVVTVLMRFPGALKGVGLQGLTELGYAYRLFFVPPEGGQPLLIVQSSTALPENSITVPVEVPGSQWQLSVGPAEGWRADNGLQHELILALLFSFLLAGLTWFLVDRRIRNAEQSAIAHEIRHTALFQSMSDGVCIFQPLPDFSDFRMLELNPAAERIMGVQSGDLAGKNMTEAFPGVMDAGLFQAFQRVARTGVSETVALTQYQDERIDLWVENEVMRLPSGELLTIFSDISEQKKAEAAIRFYASVFQSSGESIILTDRQNRILEVNPAFCRLTGYSPEEVRGRDPKMLASGHTSPETYEALWQSLRENGFWQGELWDRNKDGASYPKWAAITAVKDDQGTVLHHIASFTDISELKDAQARIHHLAHHDSLTGLLNRYSLESRMEQMLLVAKRNAQKMAVMFIDMDRFKIINDTLGHHAGDLLLIEVAERLQRIVRESDILARLGGDEFVVVLGEINKPTDACLVAEKIVTALSEAYQIDGKSLHSSPSVGITFYPDDALCIEDLMKNADTAMYDAKARGRNTYRLYSQAQSQKAQDEMALERDLGQAIQNREFELHYQPQICGATGKETVVEALLRWHHPERGLIPPSVFIPIAEEYGLINHIGSWVIGEACQQLSSWKAKGVSDVRMAVNLSVHQLKLPHLVDDICSTLKRHGLTPADLELEVTESAAMSDPEWAIQQLSALKARGIRLAIDDFGTGYSSLAYLKRLPVQTLKLDREFVRDIETDGDNKSISAATLALARSLGLSVVAEGVETGVQKEFLLRHGCDYLQGYYFAKPMPSQEIWKRWRPANK